MPEARNIVLIGMMGSGKSSVGLILSQRLARPFVDTDAAVEVETSRSIAALFAAEGEPEFRRRERAVVRRAAAGSGQVIAVGGGAVCDARNVRRLRAGGVVVWLDADAQTLAARVGEGAGRPLLAGATPAEVLATLRAERLPAYGTAADHRVDTAGLSPAQVADAVMAALGPAAAAPRAHA